MLSILTIKRFCSTVSALPFVISLNKANEIFVKHHRFLESTPHQSKSTNLTLFTESPIKQCYLPFHSIDIKNLKSSYEGYYGHDRVEYYTILVYNSATKSMYPQTHSRIVTDWYRTTGLIKETNYPLGTNETQIYAGFKYPRSYVESCLRTRDIIKIRPLSKEMTINTIVDPFEMTLAYSINKILENLYQLEKERIEQYLISHHHCDRSKVNTIDIHLEQAEVSLYSYYMPTYIYSYIIHNLTFYKFLNAYNGIIQGQKVYSIWKSALLGSSIGLIGGFLTYNPYLSIPLLLLRLSLMASITALPTGLLAYFNSKFINKSHSDTSHHEKKNNDQYFLTEDDIKLRQFSSSFISHINVSSDYAQLLGLDTTKEITLKELKEAYFKQLKKWHPDSYQGSNPELATMMTVKINDAYHHLLKQLSG